MKRGVRVGLLALISLVLLIGAVLFFQHFNVAVLNPQGEIARQQRDLIVFTTLLSSVIVIPVFAMLGIFAWKYRDSNRRAKYRPDWDGNKGLEIIWWGIPCAIILVLGAITWRTSHELDPYKTLNSNVKPVNIQVVALQWKWLFIYPDLGVASVNFMQIPKETPIDFTISADAPMNSFWIPSLGGQVYAMSGMSTKLHLMADHPGEYKGSSANISGKGFADMAFTVRSSSQVDFTSWVNTIKQTSGDLDMANYKILALPAILDRPTYYALKENHLYDKIVMKYMAPMNETNNDENSAEHAHSDMMDMPDMEGM